MPWHAQLHLNYERRGDSTAVHHRHSGPLRVFKSLYPEGSGICHNVVVHPPGGLVQGDRLDIHVQVETGAHALVSTPGATRFYRSDGEPAAQHVKLQVASGARLEWLPLETLAYSGCRGVNTVELDLAPGAELLAWDVLSLGLPASGLPFVAGEMTQRWQWPGHWLEQARMAASDTRLLHSPLGMAGHSAVGMLVLACGTPLERERREQLLEVLRAAMQDIGHAEDMHAGATCPNDHLLVVRALAPQVEPIMQLWQRLWALLRTHAWGLDHTPPRIWSV